MNSKSQIWLETVIYTLIGLSIIAMLLAIILPQINEKKDQIVIENTVNLLKVIDTEIENLIYSGPGNAKPFEEIKIRKGKFIIDGAEDKIKFEMETSYLYSQLGTEVSIGPVNASITQKKKGYFLTLNLNYKNKFNITWKGEDKEKDFTSSDASYKLLITNLGKPQDSDLIKIDFSSPSS